MVLVTFFMKHYYIRVCLFPYKFWVSPPELISMGRCTGSLRKIKVIYLQDNDTTKSSVYIEKKSDYKKKL